MQVLQFDVALNRILTSNVFFSSNPLVAPGVRWFAAKGGSTSPFGPHQASGDGHFPRPPDDTPLTIDSSGAYFRGESQVKGMNGFGESHPRCKQNRHSNEPGSLNP